MDVPWPELTFNASSWIFVLAVLLVAALVLRRIVLRARRRGRARRALRAERRAAKLLESCGYCVQDRQVARAWPVVVGERSLEVQLRADYLVRRGQEAFVAEVKHGAYVARIRHGPTRRQLLEYQLAYQVDGVLLVDVERQSIEKVRFPALASR